MTYSERPADGSGEAPLSDEELLHTYEQEEQALLVQASQHISLGYAEACRLEGLHPSQYLQRYEVDFGQPTLAYRRDSRYLYQRLDGRIEPAHCYIYVPADSNPDVMIKKYWTKFDTPRQNEPLVMSVDPETGVKYGRADDLGQDTSLEGISMEALIVAAIDAKSMSIDSLKSLVNFVRDESIPVPFRNN